MDPDIHPRQLTVISDVPIAHGLGSSTTAVVAGIKIANVLGDLDLSVADQINLGSRFEGHSENVASALLGQLTVSTFDGQQAVATRIELPDVYALMYIRPDGISEAESRKKNCLRQSALKRRFMPAAKKMFLLPLQLKVSGMKRLN